MKDTLYTQKFKTSSGKVIEKLVWISDMDKQNYPKDKQGNLLIPVFDDIPNESGITIITGKMSPQQVQKERLKRSSKHFKKEILPTLGVSEKIHFAKKYSKK